MMKPETAKKIVTPLPPGTMLSRPACETTTTRSRTPANASDVGDIGSRRSPAVATASTTTPVIYPAWYRTINVPHRLRREPRISLVGPSFVESRIAATGVIRVPH